MGGGHEQVGDVATDHGADDVLGDGERHLAPAVDDADVALPGGDEIDGLPRVALEQVHVETWMRIEQTGEGARHETTHRRGERDEADGAGNGPGAAVQIGLQHLELVEETCAPLDERATLVGQHDATADAFEQGHTHLALQALDLLGDGARRVTECRGCSADRALLLDGAQRRNGVQVDHEENLHGMR